MTNVQQVHEVVDRDKCIASNACILQLPYSYLKDRKYLIFVVYVKSKKINESVDQPSSS